MPNFFARGRQMPLTPPENDSYSRGACGQQHVGQFPYMRQGRAEKMYDTDAFGHPYAAPPAPLMFQPPPMNYANMPTAPPPGLPHPKSYGGPIAAPILPPINIPDRAAENHASSQRERYEEQRRTQQSKNEKAVGGVSAYLDYELDQMTDYVAEMTQSIVIPGSQVSSPFRKFVSGLLSSTRLPSSTILLGMMYLARRMNMLNTPAPFKANDGQVWRMLTIALLLGSKFLDDNTFQNRSWSEVSGIPVAELNKLEHQWLEAIDWKLHVNFDTSEDFRCWLASWQDWKEAKNKQQAAQQAAVLERLTPQHMMGPLSAPLSRIDTNVQRHQPQRKAYSPQSAAGYGQSVSREPRSAYQTHLHFDSAWIQHATAPQLSPPSAPDSGPNTPDYLSLHGNSLPVPDNWYYQSNYQRRQSHPLSHQGSYNMRTAPYSHYSHNIWNTHGSGCGCGCNSRYNESYFMAPSFGQQTVAG